VIHRTPKIVSFAVDLHKNFIEVPTPVRVTSHPENPFSADLRYKQRAKSIPPKPYSFVAHIDASFMQQILHIPK
jgi:hypothetical protein